MNVIDSICKNKVISVIRAEEYKEAIEKVEAMVKGGLKIFEITVEKTTILPAVEHFKNNNDLIILAGGVITSMRAQEALVCGANAIVSPVFQLGLAKFCLGNGVPHIATVSTPNEAYNAWKARIPIIKIFPAKSMGQVEYIEDILRPMPFLNLMPSGGLNLENFDEYLKVGAVSVGLGRCLYKDATLTEITERAKFVVNKLKSL